MKTKNKILIVFFVVVAIILMAVAINFPPVFREGAKGTFGKAEKYSKKQMDERDVMLRNELTNDTAQLKNMIQGLIYFSLFTEDLTKTIDSCVSAFELKGICSQNKGCPEIRLIADFSDYMKNNNKTLGNTISLLSRLYLKDQSDQSSDVEKNLREFGNYVKTLNEKDSVVEQALRSMDNFMLTNTTLRSRMAEFAQLKSIRDQLLIKGIQYSAIINDKPLSAVLCSYAVYANQELSALRSRELDQVAIRNEEIRNMDMFRGGEPQAVQGLNSQSEMISRIIQSQVLCNSNIELQQQLVESQAKNAAGVNSKNGEIGVNNDFDFIQGLNVVVYDRSTLSFTVRNASELTRVLSAAELNDLFLGSQGYCAIAVSSAQQSHIVFGAYQLETIWNSRFFDAYLQNVPIANILSTRIEAIGLGTRSFENLQQPGHELKIPGEP
ncbi:MAG: hypothetical protein EOM90_04265 [Alphaproteobacteria bacterium]|nr:hypothetical protein [Alphaproteobacteria bacterium]